MLVGGVVIDDGVVGLDVRDLALGVLRKRMHEKAVDALDPVDGVRVATPERQQYLAVRGDPFRVGLQVVIRKRRPEDLPHGRLDRQQEVGGRRRFIIQRNDQCRPGLGLLAEIL